MQTDFTFKNKKIAAFFNDDDSDPPIRELLYLHTHPLVTKNFINEISELVLKTNEHLKLHNIQGYPLDELIRIGLSIGEQLPELKEEGALKILKEFRLLYKLCNGLLSLK